MSQGHPGRGRNETPAVALPRTNVLLFEPMKVFISSLIGGLEAHRDATAAAIRDLDHEVIRAEDFPASTATAQQACLDGVRQSDLVVLILSSRYGALQASGMSATHEEYLEARDTRPVLAFLDSSASLEAEQHAFVQQVRDWSGGSLTGNFQSPDDLRREVTRALHRHELRAASAPAHDLGAASARALQVLSRFDTLSTPGPRGGWLANTGCPPACSAGKRGPPTRTHAGCAVRSLVDLRQPVRRVASNGRRLARP